MRALRALACRACTARRAPASRARAHADLLTRVAPRQQKPKMFGYYGDYGYDGEGGSIWSGRVRARRAAGARAAANEG